MVVELLVTSLSSPNYRILVGILFEEKLCEIVLRNLRSASEQDKVVGLIVATHLLTSSEKILKPKIKDLISILHSLLNESSVKVNPSSLIFS